MGRNSWKGRRGGREGEWEWETEGNWKEMRRRVDKGRSMEWMGGIGGRKGTVAGKRKWG